jgi:hypothetical protein
MHKNRNCLVASCSPHVRRSPSTQSNLKMTNDSDKTTFFVKGHLGGCDWGLSSSGTFHRYLGGIRLTVPAAPVTVSCQWVCVYMGRLNFHPSQISALYQLINRHFD